MSALTNVSRRGFLQGVLSSGALVLCVHFVPEALWAAEASPQSRADQSVLHPSVYVGVDTDGTVYIIAHRSEMGTTSRTSLPLILADELDADWARVRVQQAIGDPRYGSQDTDGSHSIREFYQPMREAGATARLMLVRAAAQQWGVPEAECTTDLHVVVHKAIQQEGRLRRSSAESPLSFLFRRKKSLSSSQHLRGVMSGRARPATTFKTSAPAKRNLAWTLASTAWFTLRLNTLQCSGAN